MKCKKVKVHIITDDIKRERLYNFCQSQIFCEGCPLNKDFPCGRGTHFFTKFYESGDKYDMSKEIIDKAYKKVFNKKIFRG